MLNNSFEFSVEVNDRRIPEYGHKGRTYVEGRKGNRYTLKFRNNRAERVLVVPTVDGLSVVDGNPYNAESSGYVVQAYSSIIIAGWRTSLAEVRAFEFSEKGGSYAGKTVGHANCGVIGAAVYSELRTTIQWQTIHYHHIWPTVQPCPDYSPIRYASPGYSTCVDGLSGTLNSPGSSDSSMVANMLCSASNSAPDFNMGTGFGGAVTDHVNTVTFDRGMCLATFEIYYSDRDGLMKDGIQVDKTPELASFPQAFGGFCKPPA